LLVGWNNFTSYHYHKNINVIINESCKHGNPTFGFGFEFGLLLLKASNLFQTWVRERERERERVLESTTFA